MKLAAGIIVVGAVLHGAESRSPAKKPTVIAVIVNKRNAVDSLTTAELRSIFLKKRQTWSGGKSIIPLNASLKSKIRNGFEKLVLKMKNKEVGNFWVKQLVKGRTTAPRSIATPQIRRRMISALKGAISYVDASKVDSSVKVIEVDGSRPGDEEYKLIF